METAFVNDPDMVKMVLAKIREVERNNKETVIVSVRDSFPKWANFMFLVKRNCIINNYYTKLIAMDRQIYNVT